MADDVGTAPLSAETIAELDAAYRPFPAFDEWPRSSPLLAAWDASRQRFAELAEGSNDEALERAREIALRAAAFDTGAIEGLYATNRGLTFTVAEQSALWEQKVEAQGPDALALFEAQLKAFDLVLDHVTDRVPEITQAWIRRIHEEITAPQETYLVHTPVGTQEQALPRGEYKKHPNHVRTHDGRLHAYAPVASTSSEMERLLTELDTPEFKLAHPVIQAAYIHYAFVAIHPFADGNGRVARALASTFTYRAASVPLLIMNDERERYFEALATADHGNAQPFVDFAAGAARDAVELVRDNLETALAPQPDVLIRQFDERNRMDPTSRERDEIGLEVGRWVYAAMKEQIEELSGASVQLSVEMELRAKSPPRGYRVIRGSGTKGLTITAATTVPAQSKVLRKIEFYISDDPRSRGSFLLQVTQGDEPPLTLDLDALWPKASALSEHRLANFVRRVVGEILKQVQDEVTPRP